MILKCGNGQYWNIREIKDAIKLELENGIWNVYLTDSSWNVSECIECKSEQCYLMNDEGKTIQNLSPLRKE